MSDMLHGEEGRFGFSGRKAVLFLLVCFLSSVSLTLAAAVTPSPTPSPLNASVTWRLRLNIHDSPACPRPLIKTTDSLSAGGAGDSSAPHSDTEVLWHLRDRMAKDGRCRLAALLRGVFHLRLEGRLYQRFSSVCCGRLAVRQQGEGGVGGFASSQIKQCVRVFLPISEQHKRRGRSGVLIITQ